MLLDICIFIYYKDRPLNMDNFKEKMINKIIVNYFAFVFVNRNYFSFTSSNNIFNALNYFSGLKKCVVNSDSLFRMLRFMYLTTQRIVISLNVFEKMMCIKITDFCFSHISFVELGWLLQMIWYEKSKRKMKWHLKIDMLLFYY